MDGWTREPPGFPFRCHRTGLDATSGEAFYCEGWWYAEQPENGMQDDRQHQLIHSAQWIREMCQAPGSPFVLMNREDHEHLLARLVEAQELIATLEEEAAAAEEHLGEAAPAIDTEALISGLGTFFDQRYARKTGPKAKADA